jgi:ElaB/YqjD/DUF883 family membrane-anchored ribosome-binding protein
MATDAEEKLDIIQSNVRRVADKLIGILNSKENEIEEKVSKELRETVRVLETTVDELKGRINVASEQLADTVEQTVQKHPFATLAASFGVGMIIGALLRK